MKKSFDELEIKGGVIVRVIRTGADMTALLEMPGIQVDGPCGLTHMKSYGGATCYVGDDFDFEDGADLAIAHALESMAAQLRRRAAGNIKHRADMKEQKRKQIIRNNRKRAQLSAGREFMAGFKKGMKSVKEAVLPDPIV